MTDKTIKERGISAITLPAPTAFSFDAQTRQLELTYYFQYCLGTGLITVTGEQARTTLIRKTFNHLGASGSTWEEAMRSWLQGELSSSETNLYKLWQAYFTAHATVADDAGITYADLSVESGYRKFLSDFIGGSTPSHLIYTDSVPLADNFRLKQGKFFDEALTMSDAANFIRRYIRTFSDTAAMSDAFSSRLGKGFLDSMTMSDLANFKQKKGFNDVATLSDVFVALFHIIRTYSDTVSITDKLELRRYISASDSVTMSDLLSLVKLSKAFNDSMALSDLLTLVMNYRRLYTEQIDLIETVLFRLLKNYSDSITMSDSVSFVLGTFHQYTQNFNDSLAVSDSVIFAQSGYNKDFYNTGVYNR